MQQDKGQEIIEAVKTEYDGNVGLLWELLMGRHIHIGGFYSTSDLAAKAGIAPNMKGLELCCNNAQTSRFLCRYRGVKHMTGIDLSPVAIKRAKQRCIKQGFMNDMNDESRVKFINRDITKGLPMLKNESFDFIISEDAWCYIPDKGELIKTCAPLLKPGGTLAFTDWCLGPNHEQMTKDEYRRFITLMTFPNVLSVEMYSEFLENAGLDIVYAHSTQRFLPCIQIYIDMLEKQFKGDVLDMFNANLNQFDIFFSFK